MSNHSKTVLVVCRGNIARSPFVEAIIRQELVKRKLATRFTAISRGVQGTTVDPEPVAYPNLTHYAPQYRDSKSTLRKFGVDLSLHRSTAISQKAAQTAGVILAVDLQTKDALCKLFPTQADKMYLLSELVGGCQSIPDPMLANGSVAQEKIFTETRNLVVRGFPRLLAMLRQSTRG